MDFDNKVNSSDNETADFASDPSGVPMPGQGANVLMPDAENVVVLPDGASLDDVQVRGRDLVVEMPDGRVFIIPNGAVDVPVIVVDGVAVPPLNLAAYLTGEEPQPAAGTT